MRLLAALVVGLLLLGAPARGLDNTGRVWLGVAVQEVTKEVANALGMKDRTGALVARVTPDSPAEKAGIKPGDVILSFDGLEVPNPRKLPPIVAKTPVDKNINIEVLRQGKRRTLEAKLEFFPDRRLAHDCEHSAPADRVAACTQLIQSGRATGERLAFFLSNRCYAQTSLKQLDKAIVDCNEAIRVAPRYWFAFFCRGRAFSWNKLYESALKDFNLAVRLDPQQAVLYFARGTVYAYQGKYDIAIREFDEAIRLNPNYSNAYHNRGSAYQSSGRMSHAIADYRRALQTDPSNTHAKQALQNLGQKVAPSNGKGGAAPVLDELPDFEDLERLE